MPEEHAINTLAENEVIIEVKGNRQVNDGWLVFDKVTGNNVAYISESGIRTNY